MDNGHIFTYPISSWWRSEEVFFQQHCCEHVELVRKDEVNICLIEMQGYTLSYILLLLLDPLHTYTQTYKQTDKLQLQSNTWMINNHIYIRSIWKKHSTQLPGIQTSKTLAILAGILYVWAFRFCMFLHCGYSDWRSDCITGSVHYDF